MMKNTLQGIRILDLTRLLPGPLATMELAELGAEVIRIENPKSIDFAYIYPPYINKIGATYLAVNRSKKSVSINYRSEEGRKLFLALVASADVVVEQFRPNVLDKLGIGYEAAKRVNPSIIYASLTGYGQSGPYAQQAGHDLNYLGYAGFLMMNTDEEGKPVIPGSQVADIAAGAYRLTSAVLGALLHRFRTGQGQHLDIAMLDGLLPLLTIPFALAWANQHFEDKNRLPLSGGLANYNVYECADKKWIVLGALEPKFWTNFCKAINRPDFMPLLLPEAAEKSNLHSKVTEIIRSKTRQEWLEINEQFDACITPVLTLEEAEKDPHIIYRKVILQQEKEGFGQVKSICTLGMMVTESEILPTFPPNLGEDTTAILKGAS